MIKTDINNKTILAKEGYKETKLGWIPKDWSTPTVGEVFEFLKTTSFSRNQLNYDDENDVFYIHYGDIHATYKKPLLDFEIETNIPKLNSDVVLPNSIQYLKDGDVIIADASEDYEGVGEAIEMKNLNDKKVISGLHTFALRDLKNKTVPGFRTYIFKNPNVKKALKTIATGSKVYGISKSNVQKFKIVLPSLQEQQKIAQILATWDVAINKQEALIAQKQEQKKGLMQQLLTGKKRFAGFTDVWEEVKITEVADKIWIGLVTTMTKYYVEEGVRLIRNSNIRNNFIEDDNPIYLDINFANQYERRKLKIDDVVTVHTGDVGTSAIIDATYDGAHGFATLNTRVNKRINNKFLTFYFNSEKYKNWAVRFSTGDGRNNLNMKDFLKSQIHLPSLLEQQKIAEVLTAADNEITALQQQLQKLKTQKQGLMQQLLTGKIRVKIN